MNNDDAFRDKLNIYWAWYQGMNAKQRHEHYSHKLRHKPKMQHYNEAVKELPGVMLEIKNRKLGDDE